MNPHPEPELLRGKVPRNNSEKVIPSLRLTVIKEDEPDNRILECAVEGKCDYIISGDEHHILPLREYKGIKILRAAEFLNLKPWKKK